MSLDVIVATLDQAVVEALDIRPGDDGREALEEVVAGARLLDVALEDVPGDVAAGLSLAASALDLIASAVLAGRQPSSYFGDRAPRALGNLRRIAGGR